jgi:glyoxylase-like metal-dependent hydrolase (beta-lactamase superfamily II)/rhodanese-related sulfurtransferase
MEFTQYYLDCLSHASYLIGDKTTGRAVVVDPRRDVADYVADAAAAGLTIELVLETHFHADFLSGHLELAAATGAEIGYSSVAETEFESRKLADGERISLGEVQLDILHTPGHTPESISIVVWEHADDPEPYGVLTGDTLFIGDVGRPDLLASIGFSGNELAEHLYDSLHNKLLPLPDATRVYPAHGAGSACGKNLSTDTWSTMGEQRMNNYALLAPDKQTFIDLVTEGQPPAPGYFAYDAIVNRKDRQLLDETAPPPALDLQAVDQLVSGGAMIIDGRDPEAFAAGYLAGSINVGLNGRYAEFAGSVVPHDVDIVLVVESGAEMEAKNRLARIGFDRVAGFLANPSAVLADSAGRVQHASRMTASEFEGRRGDIDGLQLVDIRNPGEVALGTIDGAVAIPVGQLPSRSAELDPSAPTVVFCAGGYRSSVGASVLRQAGFTDVSDILGGYSAWAEQATVAA